MRIENVSYYDDATELEAFIAYPSDQKRPLVLLCHAWKGKDSFICDKAKQIAELGYIGFALDMYGKGIVGNSKEQNAILKKPFIEDRYFLQKRVVKAFKVASELPYVDRGKIAVLGFGFGGICALDLARSGVDLKGTISIYGHFNPPPASLIQPIRSKVLVVHGYNDSIVPESELMRFENEMNDMQVDWRAHIYGNAMHAFSCPEANDPEFGILYNPLVADRAWRDAQNFLYEIFA